MQARQPAKPGPCRVDAVPAPQHQDPGQRSRPLPLPPPSPGSCYSCKPSRGCGPLPVTCGFGGGHGRLWAGAVCRGRPHGATRLCCRVPLARPRLGRSRQAVERHLGTHPRGRGGPQRQQSLGGGVGAGAGLSCHGVWRFKLKQRHQPRLGAGPAPLQHVSGRAGDFPGLRRQLLPPIPRPPGQIHVLKNAARKGLLGSGGVGRGRVGMGRRPSLASAKRTMLSSARKCPQVLASPRRRKAMLPQTLPKLGGMWDVNVPPPRTAMSSSSSRISSISCLRRCAREMSLFMVALIFRTPSNTGTLSCRVRRGKGRGGANPEQGMKGRNRSFQSEKPKQSLPPPPAAPRDPSL